MERRKDTAYEGTKIPGDYLKIIQDVFNKNFAKHLLKEKKDKESFVAFGGLFSDEVLLVITLRHPGNLRTTTCYASIDYPAPKFKSESTGKSKSFSVSEAVEHSINLCVDAIAGFFQSYFDEGRPVDYDTEYSQDWTVYEIEREKIYMKVNRDNLELEAQATALLEKNAAKKSKKKLH